MKRKEMRMPFPGVTLRYLYRGWIPPALPSTSFSRPSRTRPRPWLNRSNQAFDCLMTFWISSGERPLSQCVPRPSNRYSEVLVWVFMSAFLVMVYSMIRRTSRYGQDKVCRWRESAFKPSRGAFTGRTSMLTPYISRTGHSLAISTASSRSSTCSRI
jgi:hypothetical protein